MMPIERERDDDVDDLGAQAGSAGRSGSEKAQEAVRTHFQEDTGEDDAAGGGGFGVRVGQPGVKREHRNFNGEGEEESPEEPDF